MCKKQMPVSLYRVCPLSFWRQTVRSIDCLVISLIMGTLFLIAPAPLVNAAEMRDIELTDGSVITGEVVSMSKGIYTVRSATLGTLRIEASKVRVIRSRDSGAPGDTEGRAKSLEDKMLADGDIMAAISALQNDPDFQKVLRDPEIMRAVQAGDIAALMKNPEFMKLLNNQTVQDINKRLAR